MKIKKWLCFMRSSVWYTLMRSQKGMPLLRRFVEPSALTSLPPSILLLGPKPVLSMSLSRCLCCVDIFSRYYINKHRNHDRCRHYRDPDNEPHTFTQK